MLHYAAERGIPFQLPSARARQRACVVEGEFAQEALAACIINRAIIVSDGAAFA